MPSKQLKTAVIGVGHLGQHHARNYTEIDGSKLVAVVDNDLERAKEVAGRFKGVKALDDYRELSEVDAVSIVTPTVTHFEVSKYFLEKDVNVLVEKPITETVDQARELVDIAYGRDVVFQVGHIERFNPAASAIEGMAMRPKFMEVHRLAPFSFRSTDVSVVKDIMIHDLDIILHFAASQVVDVHAVGFPVITNMDDIANARIQFASGCVANVTASRLSVQPMRKIRLFTTNAYVSLDYLNKRAVLIKASPKLLEEVGKMDDFDISRATPSVFGDLLSYEEVEMDDYEPLKAELTSFLDAIRTGSNPVVTGSDGLRALELAERISQSIRGHDWFADEHDAPETVTSPPTPPPTDTPDTEDKTPTKKNASKKKTSKKKKTAGKKKSSRPSSGKKSTKSSRKKT
ncbi:MAG: Gfo/Idh/MocA family oxidoreductase [Planctomycetota bacterium]